MRDRKHNWWMAVPIAALLCLSAGCSGGAGDAKASESAVTTGTIGASDSETTDTESATPAPPANGASDFSGTWDGEYQQTSPTTTTGTFTIVWEQSGSELSGTITVPEQCPSGCPLSAAVNGNQVTFGVVSAGSITYSGTLDGDTMTGTYSTTDNSSAGTWTATRSG